MSGSNKSYIAAALLGHSSHTSAAAATQSVRVLVSYSSVLPGF